MKCIDPLKTADYRHTDSNIVIILFPYIYFEKIDIKKI